MTDKQEEYESAASRARRLWDGDAASTARKLLLELLSADKKEAIKVLLPWISDRVRATVRSGVREAENEAWKDPRERRERRATAVRTQTGPLPELSNMEYWLRLPVLVPGKGYVPWGRMTVADHRSRISQLRKTVDGTLDTIGRHEWAIREIMRHKGAECLSDIPSRELDTGLQQSA